MDEYQYAIQSTSRVSSIVHDVPLSASEKGLTRKVLRAEIVVNPGATANSVKACVVHQKRSNQRDGWEDLDGPNLTQTKPLTPSKFPLDTLETRELFDHLGALYGIGGDGVHPGRSVVRLADEATIIRTDTSRAALIKKLLGAEHGEEVWHLLVMLQPDLATKLANALTHDQRTPAASGCDLAQGYHISRPQPATRITTWLQTRHDDTWPVWGRSGSPVALSTRPAADRLVRWE